jgi:prolyl-tRNA synthetase
MRASQLFIPTLREDPGDAEAVSHRLLVRGGFIRQVAAGLWTFLPLGWRVHEKVAQIVREEQNAIGAQEMFMPVVTPAELWRQTGRYPIPELWKVADRMDRPFVLAMTHEETVTFHAREIRSYRELPQMLYHFQTKVRDEPRPRGGLLRVREFVMKDAYSFDRDDEGLERSFRLQEQAYHKIFERCGLEVVAVQAESGMMGGSASVDFLAPSGSGENTLVTCENGDYAADLEIARGIPRAPEFPEALDAPEEIETPGVTTIEGLAELLGIDAAATSKAMPVVNGDGTVVLGLVRGDDRLDEAKLAAALGAAIRPATEEEIKEAFGAEAGSIGPVDFQGEVIADETLREGQFVTGANKTGKHLRGVEQGRDFEASFADIRQPKEGDACPKCGGALRFQAAVEVGHIFKLETRYSEPLGARFLGEDGQEKPILMGSYGIGPGRVIAAAVEQNNDEAGIAAWPASIAPYQAHVIVLPGLEDDGEKVAAELEEEGVEVLVDDRDQRAGEKFADADLIGCPVRVTVGKKTLEDGAVDVIRRSDRSEDRVTLGKIAPRVKELTAHGS